jgi:hypothetical protein
MQGAYNGVSPHPATNAELTRAIAKHLDRPLLLPNVPEFGLRLMLGEMADIVLDGCKVSCRRIQDAGFQFQYDDLDKALGSFPV